MTENSMRKKVCNPVVNGLPQTPGLGKGDPCELMVDSDVVATGIVFYSDPEVVVKVHNEDLSKENYRVLVKYGKKPAALVPVPVPKSDIEMVKDAVGTFVQWPKKLVLISKKGEDTASSSDLLEIFLNDATNRLAELGGDILITIGCGVFNSVTNNTLNVSVDDITRVCKRGRYASVTNVVIYIGFCMRNFFHQKTKRNSLLSIQRALQSMASSSTKLTLDLITWLNKANASLLRFLILRSNVRKAWLLDPFGGCLQVGKGNSSFSFYEEKNHCESGFYIMRYMKELVERQRSELLLTYFQYFPKKKYDEGDMMEVRKEWIDHIKPYLKENDGVADMDFDYLKENDGVADMD
ncbi:hypothetical protein MKW92_011528 [Papaver armeniacum]|nr:hypothetical protein MKW92_011528 [Papaver armeniacum]